MNSYPQEGISTNTLTNQALLQDSFTKRHRGKIVIAFIGLNKATLIAAKILAESGITKMVLDDERPNTLHELLAEPGFPKENPNIQDATKAYLAHYAPHARIMPQTSRPDIAVLLNSHEVRYLDSAHLESFNLPHLVVSAGTSQSVVGPYITPQSHGQLCCFASFHELTGLPQQEISKTRSNEWQSKKLSSVTAHMLGGIIAQRILKIVDSTTRTVTQHMTTLDHSTLACKTFGTQPASDCYCSISLSNLKVN